MAKLSGHFSKKPKMRQSKLWQQHLPRIKKLQLQSTVKILTWRKDI